MNFKKLKFLVFPLVAYATFIEIIFSNANFSMAISSTYEIDRISQTPVIVCARGYTDKDGKGMYFDHQTIQVITGRTTQISFPVCSSFPNPKMALESYMSSDPHLNLKYGEVCDTRTGERIVPPMCEFLPHEAGGLLFIPGHMRDSRDYARNKSIIDHEKYLIKQALLRGQPILAVCAGSWCLWESLCDIGDSVLKEEPILVDVEHHCNSSMLRIGVKNSVVNNPDIHDVSIVKNSLLACMLNGQITTKKKPETCDGDSRQKRLARVETARKEESTYNIPDRLPVNSVHWMAPNEKRTPHQVNISAYSVGGKEYDRKNRHGDLMEPQEGCVEAFESKWGAPVIGIQWHPEGYNPGEVNSHYHGNILKFMARAGEAYAAKRKMLLELQTKYPISNFSTPIHTVETSGITGIRTMPAAIEKLEYDSKKTEPQGKFQVLKSPIVYDAIPFDLTETVLEEKIEKPIVIRVLERESRINGDSNETNHTDEYKSLREFLIKSRKTQQVIAADLRVVQSTVSYFLNGKDSPKILQSFKKKYPGVSLLTLR